MKESFSLTLYKIIYKKLSSDRLYPSHRQTQGDTIYDKIRNIGKHTGQTDQP